MQDEVLALTNLASSCHFASTCLAASKPAASPRHSEGQCLLLCASLQNIH